MDTVMDGYGAVMNTSEPPARSLPTCVHCPHGEHGLPCSLRDPTPTVHGPEGLVPCPCATSWPGRFDNAA